MIKEEVLVWVCPDCGKVIKSINEAQQAFNTGTHQRICKNRIERLVEETPAGNIYRSKKEPPKGPETTNKRIIGEGNEN